MPYLLTLALLIALYATAIYLMKYIKNPKVANPIFVALVFIPYVMLSLTVYIDVGFHDWNFQNTLPVANVSPFMFTCIPLALFLPKSVKKHFLLLISLLSVGMLLSSVFGCIHNAVINYKFHIHFTYDYVSHFTLSLFGIYVIRSKQVTLNKRNALISSSIIFGATTVMLLLNIILDTAFFGLSLNGKHNIYNNFLHESSYVSALLYYTGLSVVLLLGYAYSSVFNREKLNI